jgi:hypothetical protein
VQTPEYHISEKQQLDNTPITASLSGNAVVPNLLGNVTTAKREPVQSLYTHSNIQPVYDLYASVQDRDHGRVAAAIQNVVQQMRGKLHTQSLSRRELPTVLHALLRGRPTDSCSNSCNLWSHLQYPTDDVIFLANS